MGCSPWGREESDMTERLHFHFSLLCIGCGNVRNVLGKSFITDNAFILTKNIDENNVFILYLLTIHDLRQYARDALQPVVSNSGFKNIDIIIPPLLLQQEFASKIEKIERQKELIKQSLKETETLFNSRMDFYFN